jgi:hypothetical protein
MASPTLEAAIGGDLEETTSTTPDMVHQLVRRARGAQAVFEQFPQDRNNIRAILSPHLIYNSQPVLH